MTRRGVSTSSRKKKSATTILISVGLNVFVWGGLALLFAFHKIGAPATIDVTRIVLPPQKFKAIPKIKQKEIKKDQQKIKKNAPKHAAAKPSGPHPHFMASSSSGDSGKGGAPVVEAGGGGPVGKIPGSGNPVPPKAQTIAPKASQDTNTVPVPKVVPTKPVTEPVPVPVTGRPMELPAGPTVSAEPTHQETISIPDDLRQNDLSTFVTVRVTVDADGTAENKLLTSSGNDEVDRLVLDSLQKWKWTPAKKDGVTIPSVFDYKVKIQVEG